MELACGPIEPLVYVERDLGACEILVARIEDGSLPPAHVWSNLASFDATKLRGSVALAFGGLPCQPFSVAGKRRGESGRRYIWNYSLRIIGEGAPPRTV